MNTNPESEPAPETVTARGVLSLSGTRMSVEMTVPKGPVELRVLLPVFRSLAEAIVGQATADVEAEGRTVSCRAGCGACCRQLVPLTEPEARMIRDLVEAMPEPRRSIVRDRFAEARRRLEQSLVHEKLVHPERFTDDEMKALGLGMAYFGLGIPCPFLENESCSIYEERPIACREYLVTSPAQYCAEPTFERVHCVALPARVSTALTLVGVDMSRRFTRWVPLILALEWSETHPDDLAPRTGPEWVRELILRLTGQEIPSAPAGGDS